mmetsp:Transcript_77047/g.152884  ORF Transcript_77047/g.152884 Transcript_77047/m.152884 type:complete len:123 (-) Transcript_77047:856-1224(-)
MLKILRVCLYLVKLLSCSFLATCFCFLQYFVIAGCTRQLQHPIGTLCIVHKYGTELTLYERRPLLESWLRKYATQLDITRDASAFQSLEQSIQISRIVYSHRLQKRKVGLSHGHGPSAFMEV